jgi:hypothetical protein
MTDANAAFTKVKAAFPDAELWTEGGQQIVFLPKLGIPTNGKIQRTDALLWPWPRDSYDSRLFLTVRVPGKGDNWNVFNIQGRQWHACSWRGVPSSLPWLEILANHLRAFQ